MKYLRGYLTAAIFAAITYMLSQFGSRYTVLIDMIYPYVTRNLEGILAQWSGQVEFCLWQLFAVLLGVIVLASLVLVIVLKRNLIQWAGWVIAGAAFIYMVQTALVGLNYYAGDLSEDLRMDVTGYTLEELTEATRFYRDQANLYANQVKRDSTGSVVFDSFETLAEQAGDGFDYLTHNRYYPVFAGSTLPVKKLGWADMYSSMGITGFTFGLTGEAAVNPQIPATSLPFTMCHEMAHRMCIASERDANFTGFLACSFHFNPQFQYSAFFMAYRYCISALSSVNSTAAAAAAARISSEVNANLKHDMEEYNRFFQSKKNDTATKAADKINDGYLKTSGESAGIASYGKVCDLLVNWHIQEIVLPSLAVEENTFDPYDESQVDLSGIVNARG